MLLNVLSDAEEGIIQATKNERGLVIVLQNNGNKAAKTEHEFWAGRQQHYLISNAKHANGLNFWVFICYLLPSIFLAYYVLPF